MHLSHVADRQGLLGLAALECMSSIALKHASIITDPELDLSARSFWAQNFEEREKAFARLRQEHPVAYHRPYESTLLPPEDDPYDPDQDLETEQDPAYRG